MPQRLDVKKANETDYRFEVLGGGQLRFVAEREFLRGGSRGHWVLMMPTSIGLLEVERHQYSNDLVEWAGIHINERAVYGAAFKRVCSKASAVQEGPAWLAALAAEFGGVWESEYQDWEGRLALRRSGTAGA